MPTAVNRTRPAEVDGLRRRLGFWLRCDAARLLFPTRCLVCGEPGDEALDLCPACLLTLPWNVNACAGCAMPLPAPAPACAACLQRTRRPLDSVSAVCAYAAPVDRLVPRFKFHHDLAAGRLLAQLMAQAFESLPRPDALVPLPMHRARLRRRGFDQVLELARPLAHALHLPLLDNALVRVRQTDAQSTLDAKARATNLQGAFSVRPGIAPPAHVVLVDDVMTTGATLEAAADALRQAGVARVDAWVCARTP